MERLVIEIDGNASGLTKELGRAQKNLTGFNTYVQNGNRALGGFTRSLGTSATAVGRLATSTTALRTNLGALNRQVSQTSTGLGRLNTEARTASNSLRSFGNALSAIVGRLNAVSTASRGATTSINSLNRRAVALGTTVTAVNTALRGFLRGLNNVRTGAGGGMTVINNYSGAIAGAGVAASRTGGLFNNLHKHTLGLGESFRRTVAQITALRTLTYQALFWFAPLIYSVIKVNAQYERQMVLLKNLSKETTEFKRAQQAVEWRAEIVKFAQNAPFSMEQLTDTFVKLKVAGVDPLNGSMKTLVDSVAAFGGTDDSLQRASVALQQMAGKGVISMEELRQQLGEHVPDAMRAMATGLGMTMSELFDATKKGQVEAVDGITKMLAVLRNAHMGAAQQMMNTWNGLIARLSTTWQNFVVRLTQSAGENSFIGTLKRQILELQTFLNTPAGTNFAVSVQNALVALVNGFSSLVQWLYRNREAVVAVAKAFAIYWGSNIIFNIVTRLIMLFGRLWSILATGAKVVAATYAVLTGRTTAAAAAQLIFGANIRKAATALGILNAAGALSIRTLAMVALRFAGIVGVALAAAAAIWAVVKALNAKSQAERNADLRRNAEQGGVWDEDRKDYKQERDRLQRLKDSAQKGYELTPGPKGEMIKTTISDAERKRRLDLYNQAVPAFNLKNENTRRVEANQVDFTYREANSQDVYSAIRADFEKKKLGITDGGQRQKIEAEQSVAMGKAAVAEAKRLEQLKNKSTNPAEKKALQGLIDDKIREANEFAGGANALVTPSPEIQAKDDKEKKGGSESTFDPLERYRNQYATAFTRSEELEQEYENLRDGTGKEFDMEGADELARNTAAKIKNKEALQDLIIHEKERAKTLQQMVEIEKAAIDLENETTDSYYKSEEALEDLLLGYNSLGQQADHYRDSLMRVHKSQLDFLETQLAQDPVTDEQIEQYKEFERQYQRLTKAIDDAVRAKQAELLVDAAREAKAANEDYYAKFRTPRGQATYENSLAQKNTQSAIDLANNILSGSVVEEKVAKARDALATATAAYNSAVRSGDQARADALNDEIVVIGHRVKDEESRANQIARQSLPLLQERLRILQQEEAVRNKLHGAGGPLFDWAIQAKKGFDDIGESMGNIVTQGLDGLIEGLANGKMAFGDFVKSILKGLIMIIIRALIAKAILAALGFGGAGAGITSTDAATGTSFDANGMGANTSGIYHSGGIVGTGASSRRVVDPAIFAFAQRYHSGGIVGLRPNEVPIIAEKGEGVFSKDDMKNMGKDGGANVQVNVINQTGVETQVERTEPKFDGEKWVEQIILKKMSRPGPVRDAMRGFK